MKLALSFFVVLALAWGAILWRASARENTARAEFPPLGQFVDVNGIQVHAVVSGQGPDLVLIHGSGGNLREFTFKFIESVKDRYRVIALDRPGFGYSDRLPAGSETLIDQARILKETAVKLGADRPIVLGQSYGGAVALAWGVEFPESTAAIINVSGPSHPWDTPLDPLYRVNSSKIGATFAVPFITAVVGDARIERAFADIFTPQTAPDGYIDHFGAPLTLKRSALRANAMQRAGLLEEIKALSPRYSGMAMPIEVVHGDRDTIVAASLHTPQFVAAVPDTGLTILKGVGHMPHHSHIDDVIAAVDRAAERAGLR